MNNIKHIIQNGKISVTHMDADKLFTKQICHTRAYVFGGSCISDTEKYCYINVRFKIRGKNITMSLFYDPELKRFCSYRESNHTIIVANYTIPENK